MNKMKTLARKFWKDESGQGMAEYVLLIVVVVAVATMFKGPIVKMVEDKLSNVSGKFNAFGND